MKENWKDGAYVDHYNTLYSTPAQEFARFAQILTIGSCDKVIDFGCGKGDFIAEAVKLTNSVTGVDISREQLLLVSERFRNLPAVSLVQASFLDYEPGSEKFTKGFSRKALHHLTDEEKVLFFKKAGSYFAPGALFLLEDGIMDFERDDLTRNWERLMKDCEVFYGSSWELKKDDIISCFKYEYPAGIKAWTRAFLAGGFTIIERNCRSSFYGSILARKYD